MSLAVMAKKKQAAPEPEQAAKAARKPDPTRVRSIITNIRSRQDWKNWLLRFADHVRKDQADVIDEALLRYARAEGFELPPKR